MTDMRLTVSGGRAVAKAAKKTASTKKAAPAKEEAPKAEEATAEAAAE